MNDQPHILVVDDHRDGRDARLHRVVREILHDQMAVAAARAHVGGVLRRPAAPLPRDADGALRAPGKRRFIPSVLPSSQRCAGPP